MLKTLRTKLAEPRKGIVGVSGDSRIGHNGNKIVNGSRMDDVEVDGGEIGDDEVGKKGQKTSKNFFKSKKTVRSDFLTLGARLAFTKLR